MDNETNERFPGFPPEKQTWNFPTILNGYIHTLSGGGNLRCSGIFCGILMGGKKLMTA